MRAFDDPDLDYHTYQASRMFGVPYELVTKALRQQSKGVNFGLHMVWVIHLWVHVYLVREQKK